MTMIELLKQLQQLNIQVTVDGQDLRCKAPAGVLDSSIQTAILAHKSELIAYIKAIDARPKFNISQLSQTNNFPLSFTQQRLWFIDQLEGKSTTYNIYRAFELTGTLDISVLEQAISEIMRRHAVLRTNFQVVDTVPVQHVHPAVDVHIPIVDLQSCPADERSAETRRLINLEFGQAFDLECDQLIRFRILRCDVEQHVLLITMHHTISDRGSMVVFQQELSTLYRDFLAEQPASLPKLPIQYHDFAHWQRQYLQGETLDKHLSYWKKQLANAPELLELPTDFPRPPAQSFRGSVVSFQLDAELTQQLQALSKSSGATLFMTLLSAFSILLYRHSQIDDIVIGSPISSRNISEIEPLMGFFANTLALRIGLADDISFSELLQQIRQTALDAYDHQDLPFEKLIEELNPPRNLSYHPLFQVMFALHNVGAEVLELPDIQSRSLEVDSDTSKFDLGISMYQTNSGLVGTFHYSCDLFHADTIHRLVGHFKTLLHGIVHEPQQHIAKLSILNEAERQQLLLEWNNTQVNYPQQHCIHHLFEQQVNIQPDKTAAICQDEQLTYAQLNGKANHLAAVLIAQGIGRGKYVPVLIDRGLDLLIAHLAVMKTGAAFVPMDPQWPLARVEGILNELQSEVTLVGPNCPHQSQLPEGRCVTVDTVNLAEKSNNPNISVSTNDPIYAIFTSGSTGKPKGAVNQHRGIINRFFNMNDRYGHSEADVILCTSAHVFDSSVWQLFWPLINGNRTVITPPGFGFDLQQIIGLVEQHKVTVSDFVPSVFNILVDHLLQYPADQLKLRSLRQLLIGGEAMNAKDIYQFKSILPQVGITNTYGPTETSIGVVFYEIPPEFTQPIPIGRPLNNVYCLILDRQLNPVPVGVTGELYLGGACVGLGYLNEPAKTNAVFIDNPFEEIQSQKLYKTGDLARYQPNGNIEFLGRADQQVKIRGVRIELEEIETCLVQHPAVKRTLVIPVGEGHTQQLVSYVILNETQTVSPRKLREFLQQTLPDYMLPTAFVIMDAFPLTPNGKIDRRALPKPHIAEVRSDRTFVPPETELEQQLSQIWCDLLRVIQVSIHDNFFDLGGHSLLATQLVSRIQFAFRVKLSLRDLFETPTIAGVAERIERLQSIHQAPSAPAPETRSEREEIEF